VGIALPDDEYFMGLALEQAQHSASEGEVPVGAVVVREGEVIGVGRNAPIGSHDPTAHAEIVALRDAARRVGNYRLPECSLYVTLEPCLMCTGAIFHARLEEVVFGATDPKTGVAQSVMCLYEPSALNHQTRVRGGIRGDESAELLRGFFAARR